MKKLKGSQVVAYGFFGMFLNTFYLCFLAYFRLIYLTDVLKLSTTVSAIVNSLATWGNVVTMLLAGVFFAGDIIFFHLSLGLTSMANTNLFTNLTTFTIVPVSCFVFKEKLSKKAFAGLAFMVMGTLLMSIFK